MTSWRQAALRGLQSAQRTAPPSPATAVSRGTPPSMVSDTASHGCSRMALGQRIIVTGLPGSGKSTLSLALAAKTGLPLIHLDLHFWKDRKSTRLNSSH